MNRRLARTALLAALTLTACAGFASSAAASFHLTKIREVHLGADVAHSYVMLQLPADNEGFLMNHYVSFRAADGQIDGDHLITTNAANMGSQRTFLVGGSAVPGSDSVGASDQLVAPSGAACYESGNGGLGGLDCVSWGSFDGSTTPLSSLAGNPAPALAVGQSLVRTISRGCATALDAADDSDNSAADFSIGTPIGRNNAAAPTETVCPPGNPTSPTNPAGKTRKRKCKKKQKRSAEVAKKKKCKKKKHHAVV
jgi:hypothetical protein